MRGLHGLSCKRSAGHSIWHQQLNDIIWRVLRCADISAIKELTGLKSGDGKHPGGLALIPWQGERCLTWDATIVDILAASYLTLCAITPSEVAEAAAEHKSTKYLTISNTHTFVSVEIETLGPISPTV